MTNLIESNYYSAYSTIIYLINETKQQLKNSNINNTTINNICICIDEIISNIIKHNFNNDKTKKFYFKCIKKNSDIDLIFRYKGKKFDITQYNSEPEFNDETGELKNLSGTGIFLIKKIVNNIEYDYNNEYNIIKLSFKI